MNPSVQDWPKRHGAGKPPTPAKPLAAADGAKVARSKSAEDIVGQLFMWLLKLVMVDAALWVGVVFMEEFVEPISRRACNAAYVLWICALCFAMVIVCMLTEAMGTVLRGSCRGIPHLLVVVNRNMLSLFLAANLLTGLVNMSVNTLAVGDWMARAIVVAYMMVVAGLAVVLDYVDVTVKFW